MSGSFRIHILQISQPDTLFDRGCIHIPSTLHTLYIICAYKSAPASDQQTLLPVITFYRQYRIIGNTTMIQRSVPRDMHTRRKDILFHTQYNGILITLSSDSRGEHWPRTLAVCVLIPCGNREREGRNNKSLTIRATYSANTRHISQSAPAK